MYMYRNAKLKIFQPKNMQNFNVKLYGKAQWVKLKICSFQIFQSKEKKEISF